MNKKIKIILGTILLLIVSVIGGFYLLSYLIFTAWTGQNFVTQAGKEAQSIFFQKLGCFQAYFGGTTVKSGILLPV